MLTRRDIFSQLALATMAATLASQRAFAQNIPYGLRPSIGETLDANCSLTQALKALANGSGEFRKFVSQAREDISDALSLIADLTGSGEPLELGETIVQEANRLLASEGSFDTVGGYARRVQATLLECDRILSAIDDNLDISDEDVRDLFGYFNGLNLLGAAIVGFGRTV